MFEQKIKMRPVKMRTTVYIYRERERDICIYIIYIQLLDHRHTNNKSNRRTVEYKVTPSVPKSSTNGYKTS